MSVRRAPKTGSDYRPPLPGGKRYKYPTNKSRSEAEEELTFQMMAAGLPPFQRQARFDKKRKFLADFLFETQRLIVEVQGGTWTGGRHVHPKGYEDDCERMIIAQLNGYRIAYVTSDMVWDGRALKWVIALIANS